MPTRDTDILIAGSGLVGLGIAAALRHAVPAWRVTVVDAVGPPPQPADAPGLRVSAIAPSSVSLLQRVGAWQRLPGTHAAPFTSMRVWDAATECGDGVAFHGVDHGRIALGHIVDNAMLRHCLYRCLVDDRAFRLLTGRLSSLQAHDDRIVVTTDSGESLSGRLLVGADGRDSSVRALSGMPVRHWSHDQAAVVAHLASEHDHQGCALQRFLPDGPLALLPLPDGRVSLVWTTEPGHAAELVALDDDAFAAAVTDASDAVLGALRPATRRVSFPLSSHYVADPVGPRTLLAGDAAHAVHPLAGQGVNLGFADAECLADVATRAAARHGDIGDPPWLRNYRRARKLDSAGMVYGLDLVNRLFARERGALADLRRAGMRWFDASPVAKRFAAARAMGDAR